MAAERLSMRKLREIFRLHFEQKLGNRAIGQSLKLSPSTVHDYLLRAKVANLSWPLPAELDDDGKLSELLFRPSQGRASAEQRRPEPDFARLYQEMAKRHVTLQLLWQEYREQYAEGYQYSWFTQRYQQWLKTISVTMRQNHRAGEKLFVDFSGDGIDIVDRATGECQKTKLFVAVLGASNLTYVEPVLSEDLPTWIGCHVRAFAYMGGVARIWVPDNLKSGVKKPSYYEPDINPTYAELARHYDAVVIPARVRKPRDKAKVEQGVLLAERWILAALRRRTFHSLVELRTAIEPLLDKLNQRPMKKLNKSRWQLFEEIEKAELKPLPVQPYVFAEWTQPRVNIDYHVEFDGHYYSVPSQLVGKRVELRASEATVEILLGGRRVASHMRSWHKHRHTTQNEHMPKSHRAHSEWSPSRLIHWAGTIGPSTAALVEAIMTSRRHPEQGFRSCLGVMRLQKRYNGERLERACARALKYRIHSYKSVAAILNNNLDQQDDQAEAQAALPLHENVRGADYYH